MKEFFKITKIHFITYAGYLLLLFLLADGKAWTFFGILSFPFRYAFNNVWQEKLWPFLNPNSYAECQRSVVSGAWGAGLECLKLSSESRWGTPIVLAIGGVLSFIIIYLIVSLSKFLFKKIKR